MTRVSVSVFGPMVEFLRDVADCGLESMSFAVCEIGCLGMKYKVISKPWTFFSLSNARFCTCFAAYCPGSGYSPLQH